MESAGPGRRERGPRRRSAHHRLLPNMALACGRARGTTVHPAPGDVTPASSHPWGGQKLSLIRASQWMS